MLSSFEAHLRNTFSFYRRLFHPKLILEKDSGRAEVSLIIQKTDENEVRCEVGLRSPIYFFSIP